MNNVHLQEIYLNKFIFYKFNNIQWILVFLI